MTPVTTLGAQLAAGLEAQADRVARFRRRVLKRREAEDVHRLRVALRRLRVATGMAGRAMRLSPGASDRAPAAIASSLGKLRDTSVALARLLDISVSIKGREVEAADRVVARLRRRERKQLDRARQSLRHDRVRRLLLGLRRTIRRPDLLPLGKRPLDRARKPVLAPSWKAVVEHGAWRLPPVGRGPIPRDAERSRHELRIRIKELRDSLQLLAETPIEHQAVIDRLDGLASALGDLRDLNKLRAQIEGTSPTLTLLVERQLAQASEQWDALRAAWLADPPHLLGTPAPRSPATMVPNSPPGT